MLKIALADLTHHNKFNVLNLYVPLNVSLVAAYAQKRFGNAVEIEIHKTHESLLGAVKAQKHDLVGISSYYWKNVLNKTVVGHIDKISPDTLLVVGGPNIDSDHKIQDQYFKEHPQFDALIPNEGEVAFSNLIEAMLGGQWDANPIAGVVSNTKDGIKRGSFINLATSLDEVPSPYLSGIMKPWLEANIYQPLIQTSRLCPYTCAFCTSGKDRGKIRAFELDQLKAEIEYIALNFKGDPNTLMYITDDNFGIMPRDLEVADYLLKAQKDFGYPNRIYFYNDKRFTQISRDLHQKVGHMCYHGVCLSLQSENKDALKAISRRNLTDEQLQSALTWAKGLKLRTSTELIFGLPGETLESYCATIDKCARYKFDVINSYNLIMFDGIEMNRPAYRAQYALETIKRPIPNSYSTVEGETIQEYEEIVVSSSSFSKEDFLKIRKLNMLLREVYIVGIYQTFFRDLILSGKSLTGFLLHLCDPNYAINIPHRSFCDYVNHCAINPEHMFLKPAICASLTSEGILRAALRSYISKSTRPKLII